MIKIIQIFEGNNGRLSSKRIFGTICLIFTICFAYDIISVAKVTKEADWSPDIAYNVFWALVLLTGSLLGLGIFEKK